MSGAISGLSYDLKPSVPSVEGSGLLHYSYAPILVRRLEDGYLVVRSSGLYSLNLVVGEGWGQAQIGAVSGEAEFRELAERWILETGFVSSVGEIVSHPAYQRIMAMGKRALPWILSDLRENPRHWFYALTFIVGRDLAAGLDSYAEARAAWLEWGYRQNYI